MDLLIHKRDQEISGVIPISGAKNSAVAIIPAALLSSEKVILENIPHISDVETIVSIIDELGHFITFENNKVTIIRNNKKITRLSNKVRCLRGSYYFISVYLSLFNEVYIPQIGGCKLGDRPINYHFDALKELGVDIYTDTNNYTSYKCKKIKSKTITLPYQSVGTTINIILISVLSNETVIINNASIEPEVMDVCNFLNYLNANISVSDRTITIKGVSKLSGGTYKIISDRIEAGTYLALIALPKVSKITLTNINYNLLISYLNILQEIGFIIDVHDSNITIRKSNLLKPITIYTNPYPGFPTDLAPIITVILTQINGTSKLIETVFRERFSHVKELNKLGANISINNNTIIINGKTNFITGTVTAHDLRCAAALLLSGIASLGNVLIKDIDHLFRGYEDPIKKLQAIGVTCRIIN